MKNPSDDFDVPEKAIAAFEALTGLSVTLHDIRTALWPFLPPERFRHSSPRCAAVKARFDAACIDFEVVRLRREIPERPTGRVQVCHAGLVEWVMPVIEAGRLEWVLFAGQRSAGAGLRDFTRDSQPPPRGPLWPKGAPPLKPVDDAEAQLLLENLRQLAARLQNWAQAVLHARGGDAERAKLALADGVASRRAFIRSFIYRRHAQPLALADLAAALHVSETRAGHVVREVCGANFMDLLAEARVRTATALLRHSNLAICDVAAGSGFGDVSNFHRAFRKRIGLTPHQYRRQARTT